MKPAEKARALITAQAAEDRDTRMGVAATLTQDEMPAVAGVLTAYCGNLLYLLAHEWGCSPAEAWERVLAAEREVLGQ